jgi:PEGA domain
MRLSCAVIVLIGLPAVAVAQTAEPPPPRAGSLPPIGLPLPPIGLPLPAIGLPQTGASQPGNDALPARRQRSRGRGLGNSVVFVVPTYGWGALAPGEIAPGPYPIPEAPPGAGEQQLQFGALRLELDPPHAQLFVNGEYIGTPEDFNGELELAAGSHTFEIRAAGYETLVVNVKIAPGRTITYRGELKRTERESPSRAPRTPSPERPETTKSQLPAAPPSTFYYIPGCYLGNLPPEKVALPANCDLSRLVTRRY